MGRLSKDKRDIYYREAKQEGFRARSAFKLLQIDEELDLLQGVRRVADLCAAPGSWSQVLAMRLFAEHRQAQEAREGVGEDDDGERIKRIKGIGPPCIVAVDKYEMEPIDGVVQVQGDITHASTVAAVLSHFGGELADLVVCDGAPDATFRCDFDEYVQHQLVLSELLLAKALLRPGGAFVAKIFRGEHACEVYALLQRSFDEVLCCKPRASRNSSHESFVVCRGFRPNQSGLGLTGRPDSLYSPDLHEELVYVGPGAPAVVVPFVSCGGPGCLDADTNYAVSADHEVLGPVAPPRDAPYLEAIAERRLGRAQNRPAASTVPSPPEAAPAAAEVEAETEKDASPVLQEE